MTPSMTNKLCRRRFTGVICTTLLVCASGCDPMPIDDDSDNGNDTPSEPEWREAFTTTDDGFLSGVWGSGPDDVFVVGGQPERSVVFHFDGATWETMDVPETPILIWAFGFGPDDVYAVGEQGTALRYDGATWVEMATGIEDDLWGIWGASPDDLWAVGGEIDTGPPVLLHFDGESWTSQTVPPLDRESTALLKIWGTSNDHIFAVGQTGLILEYDGNDWQQIDAGTADDLVSLWGTGPEEIVAVGGRTNGTIATYNGTQWTSRSAAPLPGLNGVFPLQEGEYLIGGLIGSAAVYNVNTDNYQTETTPTARTIHAIWHNGANTTYAVGGRSSETPYTGVALTQTYSAESTESVP